MDVAVVIPARNREASLGACLESVLAQGFRPAEVVVVDDGSSDRTVEVAQAYAERGIRCVGTGAPLGAQAARNLGVRSTRSDWVAFQDSDDVWLPRKLERQVQALVELGGDRRLVVHGDGVLRRQGRARTERLRLPAFRGACYERLLLRPGPMFPCLLVHRSALEEIGYLDEACPSYQEWDTAIRLARRGRFVHLREPLFEWRRHGGETISHDDRRSLRGFRYVTEKHRGEIVRIHGAAAWARLRARGIARALRAGLFDEVMDLLQAEDSRVVFRVAKLLAAREWSTRGVKPLLGLASLVPF